MSRMEAFVVNGQGITIRALRVAGIYAVVAMAWIVLSDRVAFNLLSGSAWRLVAETVKGGLFVLVTAGLLFFLLRRELVALAAVRQKQHQQQEWLRAMADTTTDIIFVRDRDGRYQFVNRMHLQSVQRTESEVLGRDDRAFFPPDEAAFIMETDRRVMSTGETVTVEEWVTNPLNGRRHLTATKGPLRDAEGRITGVFGIVRDITPMKRAEEILQAREERLRQIADVTSDIVYVTNDRGIITYVSRAITPLAGYAVADVEGRPFAEFLADEDADRVTEVYRTMLANQSSTQGLSLRIRRSDGTFFHGEVNASFCEVDGTPGTMGVVRDVSERHRAEEARQQAEAAVRWKETQLAASLDATADGILAVDDQGRTIKANARFAALWRIPSELLEQRDDAAMLAFVLDQLIDPTAFLERVKSLYGTELVDMDTLFFKDGRIYERYSSPMRMDGRTVGRVWSFRDITERRRNEEKLRHLNEVLRAIRSINQVILREHDAETLCAEACSILQRTCGYAAVVIDAGGADVVASEGCNVMVDVVPAEDGIGTRPISVSSDGQTTLAALPLHSHGRSLALMKVRADRVRAFETDELSLLATLANDLAHALHDIEDRRVRHEAEQKLRMEDAALAATSNGVTITDPDGRIVWTNVAVTRLTGYTPEELIGQNPRLLKSGRHDAEFYRNMWATILAGKVWQGEIINRHKAGRLCHEEMSITPILGEHGVITHFVAINQDITERVHLQQQLVQSQKMETVGRLAGGVAHDFNNLLQAILGYVEMLLSTTPAPDPRHADLLTIQKTGRRAADLTRQLLALGQKQNLTPRVTDLNALIVELFDMLQRVLGEDIRLELDLSCDLPRVEVDQGQIGQILLNLAINARDAMPRGGGLIFRTFLCDSSREELAGRPELLPGNFVSVSVTDTGTGMTPEVMANLFQPFFTTKAPGKGTGLGLATCYGIARQHGGWMDAQSEPGQGATLRLHLPAIDHSEPPADAEARPSPPAAEALRGNGQRILFVEDADAVRPLVSMLLEHSGYAVTAAADAASAKVAFDRADGAFDLVLTDVVLPDLNGLELLEQLCAKRPMLKVLICSGYTDNEKRWPVIRERKWPFIGKPYTKDELLTALRDALLLTSHNDAHGLKPSG